MLLLIYASFEEVEWRPETKRATGYLPNEYLINLTLQHTYNFSHPNPTSKRKMQFKHTLPLTILPLLAGTALGSSCYDKGQQWKDVGTETVLDEAFRRVCDKTRLAGMYPRHEAVRTCENVAGHSFLVTIQHIDSMYSLDPWFLSSGTCFDLLKKVGCLSFFLLAPCVCLCVFVDMMLVVCEW